MKTHAAAFLAAILGLAACESTSTTGQPSPVTQQDRELLAADVRGALKIAATIPGTDPYIGAVEAVLVGYLEHDQLDWSALFAAIHEQEPFFRASLIAAGWDEQRTEGVIQLAGMFLRRIEVQLVPKAEMPEPTTAMARTTAAPAMTGWSEPREVRTIHEGGAWHFLNGERRDNFGDGFLGIVLIGDQRWYVAWMRMGGPGVGGCFWFKKYDKNPYDGWSQGQPPGWTGAPIKSFPGGEKWLNLDTYCFAQNPATQVMTQVFAAKPRGIGDRYFLVRATSQTIDPRPEAYTWDGTPLTEPNTQECSLVIDPWIPCGYLFYVEKTTEAPDPYGIRFRSRVWRQRIDLRNFDTDPRFVGEPEMVFSPDQDAQPPDGDGRGPWGTAFTVLQPGVVILPNRVYMMAALGKEPIVHPNGQTAVGQMNRTTSVGIWLSFDQGKTWQPHPRNPVFSREFLGLVEQHGNQINSPHFFVDPWQMIVYFAAWVNPTGEVNMLGTRLVLSEMSLR